MGKNLTAKISLINFIVKPNEHPCVPGMSGAAPGEI